MSFSIAVAGKGGSGKTSVTSLIIRYLKNNKLEPVLAIDADSNANLAEGLGLEVKQTVGSIIAAFNDEKINIPPGMTKEAYLEYKLNGAITEGKGLDLLTMGRGEGSECYCYPNLLLRKLIDSLSQIFDPTEFEEEVVTLTALPVFSTKDMSIEEIELPLRVTNALKKTGYTTIESLIKDGRLQVGKAKNVGEKSLKIVDQWLKKKGLSW